MVGIISFLVQWVALSYFGSQQSSHNAAFFQKSHWSLLNELSLIPEDDIEIFLPQICNILTDREVGYDEFGLFQQFERVLLSKCANCLTFGMRVCFLLKVLIVSVD